MKFLNTLIIVPTLALLFAGCGTKKETQPSTVEQTAKKQFTVGIVYDTAGRGDKSFNDGAARGIIQAEKELDIKAYQIDSRNANDYESNILSLIQKDVDLLIVVGITAKKAVEKMAKEYPNQKFVYVDAHVDLPNVRSLVFEEQEGSFLAGYIAGLVSKTKKVGFVGGMDIPLILKFYSGFAAGAMTADHKITILPPKFTGDWSNVDAAKTAANVLYGQGADVIFQAAAGAGMGVLKAAKENHKLAIGVDSDQDHIYPGSVLTSMLKLVDAAVFDTIKDLKEGKFTAGEKIYGLKEKGVGITEMKYTKHLLSAADWKKYEDIRKQVVDGKIVVPSTLEALKSYELSLKR